MSSASVWLKAGKPCSSSIPWPQLFDDKGWKSAIVRQYEIKGIPATYLIGRNRYIIARNLYGEALEAAIVDGPKPTPGSTKGNGSSLTSGLGTSSPVTETPKVAQAVAANLRVRPTSSEGI